MADQKMVKADLKRTYGTGGKLYGPGEGVEVPEGLAASLGLLEAQKTTKPKKAAKSK